MLDSNTKDSVLPSPEVEIDTPLLPIEKEDKETDALVDMADNVDNPLTEERKSPVDVLKDDSEECTNHPLEPTAELLPPDESWEQEESKLFDQDDSPLTQPPPVLPAVVPKEIHSDKPVDTSHSKGFYNASRDSAILDLEVQGQLPTWLVGEHFTVGPGIFDIKYIRKMEVDGNLENVTATFTFGHWFDSLPLVNRFDLDGQHNCVTYRRKLTCQKLAERIRDNHGFTALHPASLFKTDSNQTKLAKFLMSGSKAPKADTEPCGARILTQIPGIDGQLFCQNYANHILELDPLDLRPFRVLSWQEVNPAFKGSSSCANGQMDPRTGEYINFSMDVGITSTQYNFFSISNHQPKGTLVASVTGPTAFVNSFALTRDYIILIIFPMLAKAGGVKFSWSANILEAFAFRANEPTLFYVISREQRQHVATYSAPAAFGLNQVNAFQDGNGDIVLDMICYEDDTILHQLCVENLRHPSQMNPPRLTPSEVRRYRLSGVSSTGSSHAQKLANRSSKLFGNWRKSQDTDRAIHYTHPEAVCETWLPPSLELPQVNPKVRMNDYTFMYGVGFSAENAIRDGKLWDSIVKADMKSRTVVASWHEPHCYPSEALFVPRPANGPDGAVAEDDGVLICVVLDATQSTSFLMILDAGNLRVLAKSDLGSIVPLSFAHGAYRQASS